MKKMCNIFCIMALIILTVFLTACGMAQTSRTDKPGTPEYYADASSVQDTDEAEYYLEDSLSDEDTDKETKYMKYLEAVLAGDILDAYSSVKSADVALSGSIDEMRANICLELQDNFTKDNAAEMAEAVAIAIGDKAMEGVTIQDTQGNMLFPGE